VHHRGNDNFINESIPILIFSLGVVFFFGFPFFFWGGWPVVGGFVGGLVLGFGWRVLVCVVCVGGGWGLIVFFNGVSPFPFVPVVPSSLAWVFISRQGPIVGHSLPSDRPKIKMPFRLRKLTASQGLRFDFKKVAIFPPCKEVDRPNTTFPLPLTSLSDQQISLFSQPQYVPPVSQNGWIGPHGTPPLPIFPPGVRSSLSMLLPVCRDPLC